MCEWLRCGEGEVVVGVVKGSTLASGDEAEDLNSVCPSYN